MEIIILPTPEDVGRVAADLISSVVKAKPTAVLGLATGSSPLDIYHSLATRVAAGELDVSQASGFALDEYVGIPLEHPESYAAVIARDVVGPLGMDPAKVRVPDGRALDIEAATAEYDAAIAAAGGVDIQILGIGANGHIGFNEPTSSFASRTRIKTLAPETRAANARFFDDPADVPTHCLTQGLGTILDAHRVVLVAQGAGKAAAIAAAVEGPLSAMCPGSALQLHQHATIVIDEAAAAELTLSEYYKYTYANKPAFQRFE
ncbi:glucosamine-6-phosphate deaminase [Frondihabitans sucicola]|uniref:Glucosamine-6-phosphate deaminase n=1 Tax=Frondihabitans sucicola TaxID=1268041 RepID=A0ABN6XW00_9MICO|nr:glucosamine-6-phosphate deaminase [Frondihabitans sucicola]BDZ49180.1 glucosamine-6-phosphate deaminase [Frondihabitans sucicola]